MKQQAIYGVAVVIAFAIILSVMVAFVRPLQVAPPSIAVVDALRPYDYCGRSVSDFQGYGQFPDPASDGRKFKEAFTMTRLWYAWFEDGKSQSLAVEGRLRACNQALGFPSPPDNIYYRFLYSEGGGTWTGFAQGTQESLAAGVYHDTLTLGAFDKDVALGAFHLQIDGFQWKPCTFNDGNVRDNGRGMEGYDTQCDTTGETREIKDGAALRVQVLVARYGGFLGLNNYEPMLVFQDEVELRNALPEVGWGEPGYEVGETARVEYTVPTTTYETCDASGSCDSRPAYFLEVRNMNTNGALPGFDRAPVTETSGSAAIPVTATYFSNDLATCQNRLRALLYSELIIVDQADTSVQQKEASLGVPAPVLTGITADKDEYSEGDLVRLNWTATGNVTKYHVTAHIGGLLLIDRDIKTTAKAAGDSAVASRTGILEVEVTPYNLCQPGDVKKEQWTVGAVYTGLCAQFPDIPQCILQGPDLFYWLKVAAAVVGLLLALVFLLWLFSKYEMPPAAQFGLPLLIILVLAAYLLGTGFFAAGLVLHRSRSSLKRRVRT